VIGWRGFEDSLRHQVVLGDRLRRELTASPAGWTLTNDTPLPVVCFVPANPAEQCPDHLRQLARLVNAAGRTRIFVVRTGAHHALRACITHHQTTPADLTLLVHELDTAARSLRHKLPVLPRGL
jgi:hypothetical protein